MRKPKIGDFLTLNFTDRKKPISGLLVDYNDDWTLIKYCPVDYIIDGYVIVRHKNIANATRDKAEQFKEKIIELKGLAITDKDMFPIDSLDSILANLTKKFGLFSLYTKSESACYLGKLKSLTEKQLIISYLNPQGKWDGEEQFKPNDIRVIEFDNDYINSIK